MPARIMVINDTQEVLDLFREILTDEGHQVILYSHAIRELEEVERHMPDLVIIDQIFGSEKLGWQLLQKLKMRRTTEKIPVIVCTAAVESVREMEGYLQAKGVGVVLKPFNINDLLHAVDLALQLPGSASNLTERGEPGAA
jgi:DNA-binding response OmpR family regulator